MIQPHELRIGNYFYDKNNTLLIVKTISVGSHGILFISNIPENLCYPIYLTEEILLKCGVEPKKMIDYDLGDIYVYHNEDIGYISSDFAYCINASNDYSEYDNIIKLGFTMKYLHQLQNLYFSLTGKELEVVL